MPLDLLFVCAGVDILVHEQKIMVERLRGDQKPGDENGVQMLVVEGGFHGFLECEYPLGRQRGLLMTRDSADLDHGKREVGSFRKGDLVYAKCAQEARLQFWRAQVARWGSSRRRCIAVQIHSN